MKRVVLILLALTFVLGMCACKKSEEGKVWSDPQKGTGFRVGFGREDITNEEPVPLAGFGNTSQRVSTNIRYRLYANAIAVTTADEQTMFFVDVDYQRAYGSLLTEVEQRIEKELGIPGTHLFVTATHTHAAPDLYNKDAPALERVKQKYVNGIYQACVNALENRKSTEMYFGSIETKNMNFVKHYQYTDADGNIQYFGDNFGTQTINETTKHTTEVDPTIWVVDFKREGDKDIVMASWRAHPHKTDGSQVRDVSSDYPGAWQNAMEAMYDCYFAYYEGYAGNVNSGSRISKEVTTIDNDEYGAQLAQYTLDCIQKNCKKIEPSSLKVMQKTITLPYNHTTDNLYFQAKAVQAVWSSTNNYSAAVAAGGTSAIRSPYHAGSIISRYNAGPTLDVELSVASFSDDFAIAACVGEPFDTLGQYIEAQSPYPNTICLGYTNGEDGYIPSAYGWEYTSYESDCAKVCPGSGEEIMDHLIGMLKEIHG